MRIRITILVIIVGLTAVSNAIGQADDSAVIIDPTTVSDGPYLTWADDSTLSFNRICLGERHFTSLKMGDSALAADCCGLNPLKDVTVYRESRTPSQFRYENVPRFLALSDIHGEYDALVEILNNTGVIDQSLNWTWGDGHLVINGDVFDRGGMVTECLWLIYRLEHQAAAIGGMVHYLLGNHELMILREDERYLNPRYVQVTIPVLETSHVVLYGPPTVLGRWLRTRNTITQLDSILFVHGGLSMDLVQAGLSADEIDQAAREWIDQSRETAKADSIAALLYGRMGPFWYRGLLIEYDYPQITSVQLDSLLEYFDTRTIVVGHSKMDSVMAYFGGRVFGLDVPVDELGGLQGLMFDSGSFFRVHRDDSLIAIDASPLRIEPETTRSQ